MLHCATRPAVLYYEGLRFTSHDHTVSVDSILLLHYLPKAQEFIQRGREREKEGERERERERWQVLFVMYYCKMNLICLCLVTGAHGTR